MHNRTNGFTPEQENEKTPIETAAPPESQETEVAPIKTETPQEFGNVIVGLVINCPKLNLRETPDMDSQVLCEVPKNDMLLIDENDFTDDFYKVRTTDDMEGFCMKKYLGIQRFSIKGA